MKGAETQVKDMTPLQLRLRDARKVISDDGYNNKFAQVFNDAIDEIDTLNRTIDSLRDTEKRLRNHLNEFGAHSCGCVVFIDSRAKDMCDCGFDAVKKENYEWFNGLDGRPTE